MSENYMNNIYDFVSAARLFHASVSPKLDERTRPIPVSYWKRMRYPHGCSGPSIDYLDADRGFYIFRKPDNSYFFSVGKDPLDAYARWTGLFR